MSFRLVPKSVTLNDPERRNSPNYGRVISPNSVAFEADFVKVVEARPTPILSAAEMRPKNLVFSVISFMAILAGITPSESVKVRHSALASKNLTNNQSHLGNVQDRR